MHTVRAAIPAVLLLLLSACANVSEEPAVDASAESGSESPLRSARSADARPFYPSMPVVRRFTYSRIAPDGSKVVGDLGLAVLRIRHSPGDDPRLLMAAVVQFRANAVIFSARQARAFHPDSEWPDDAREYPLAVKDIVEDYGFISALPERIQADPEALVLFWTRGILSYIGFSEPPSRFITSSADLPKDEIAPFCVRGIFESGAQPAGAFLLTFRKDAGLTGISGVLPDGTIIALVERLPFEGDDAPEEEIDEEKGDGLLTQMFP